MRKAMCVLHFKYMAPNLQLIHIVGNFSYFEDVTMDAGVNMDGYRNDSALSQGTYTYGSSFTVSYVELAKQTSWPNQGILHNIFYKFEGLYTSYHATIHK